MNMGSMTAAIAAQLGHSSVSMTEFYVDAAVGRAAAVDRARRRAILLIGELEPAPKFIAAEQGVCPSGGDILRRRDMPNLKCGRLEVERDGYRRKSPGAMRAPIGLSRSWHDLDREDALLAHFAALDAQLES